eukprot:m.15560 g.15560  ORF g.15560 m.15560 type:complete len:78 (-) comp4931_c0_seq1:1205-1438(-)
MTRTAPRRTKRSTLSLTGRAEWFAGDSAGDEEAERHDMDADEDDNDLAHLGAGVPALNEVEERVAQLLRRQMGVVRL